MTKIMTRQQRMEGSANVVNVIYITIGYVWTSLVLVMYIDSKESVWMAVEPKAFSVQFLLHFKMSCFRKIRMSCIITFLCLHNFYFAAKNIEVEMFYFYFVIFIFTSVSCNSCLAVFKWGFLFFETILRVQGRNWFKVPLWIQNWEDIRVPLAQPCCGELSMSVSL